MGTDAREAVGGERAGGLLAVRDLTLGEPQEAPQIDDKDDYYSASLKLLVWLAKQDQR